MTAAFDVAIVGAGPTGLTLANALGQQGLRVALIERNTTTVREPRAVSIDDESLRTMQAIGLANEVVADVALDYGSRYFTAAGRCFARVEPTTTDYGFPKRNAFTQPKLEATLRKGLDRFASVRALFGHTCESVREDGDGVRLALRDPDGAAITITSSYVVGADGARSLLRKEIGATLGGATYRQRWLIVDLASTRERLRQTRVVCNPHRPLITLPGPGGIRRYEFMLHDGEDEAVADDPAFVHALLAASGPDADAPIVRSQVYTFHARIADRWRRGRIFLAGDAAHLSPPFAGQGMNSGVRDAHNLAWKLAAVLRGQLGEGVLDSYQAEREPHARALVQLAINMGRVMMPTSPLQARLVQGAFRAAALVPAVQAYFAEMKHKPKPFYRTGFLTPSAAPLVGRMLPQPLVERVDRSRVRLDEVLGAGFALVAHGPDAERVLAEIAADAAPFDSARIAVLPSWQNPDPLPPAAGACVVRDVAGLLAKTMPDNATTLLLVRPDRYVAAGATGAAIKTFSTTLRGLAASAGPPRPPHAAAKADHTTDEVISHA
ncbi:bifunctional 3-(3-hydroxy-phenyl)propionate/3-hydroxycinnamic acid hydroxylase [Bradyrhizobium sp. U87765 SZCCT0131]|uniref:bifunctional 3-(3-hydroxy-phenyl)propionate/3-hydroxycinnamic acid hydroxylase n=1 Tax=unclassified Bradyrhizobium TaxID=2631580 RepID=UPI001BACA5E1|nr:MULTISPECIES: bifunctional 3-(3-hydroxy-phenyl)propionate/3-hydroxycinnamic acid hydroxylase [unclassified Bradyrhizobium]MBR1219007.1 bifunctional 3-(3-hydroxy-phenyl)propionate/3-hydroxycinnamic acid hydroxylase [Bradyrhizobium sp. U87765 SZCCT0131]MBR1261658.1 bifunctional 3-(3-hydroxy-phenyl)propionate/3-hydroxycinnamic acid hydroxylase [Bradyrhizobium sp. U87765 SZCCT0134]MBR1306489.1 bifunctional 3-(3-hydroxy-phenyl)propionate/3-hydroxycinnamic acid hydroxylase [Bradyrhizobium sp. U8776